MITRLNLEIPSLILIPFWLSACSQEFIFPDKAKKTIVNKGDSIQSFSLIVEGRKVSKKNNSVYCWFLNGKVLKTKGDYSGKLLDGEYELLGPDSNLIEKGSIKKGRKKGKWRRWYGSGLIEKDQVYKKGLLHGKEKRYREDGSLKAISRFSMGKKNGLEVDYEDGSVIRKRKFKIGILRWEKSYWE